jgi:hypothetical protein
MSETEAYRHSVDCVTGPVSWIISKNGLDGLYRQLDEAGREVFSRAYAAAYPVRCTSAGRRFRARPGGARLRQVCDNRGWSRSRPLTGLTGKLA